MKHKYLLCACLLLLIPCVGYSQTLTYRDLRQGKFVMKTPSGDFFFYRTKKFQIEEGMNDGSKSRYKITWPNDSTYILQETEMIRNPKNIKVNQDLRIVVEIIGLKKDSYLIKVSSNLYPQVLEAEIFKVEDR